MGISESITLIALDLDGTVISAEGHVSERLVKVVARARDRGIHVMLATGRMVQSARPYWLQLHLPPGPMITYNGALVAEMPEERVLEMHALPDNAARHLTRLAVDHGLLTQVYVGRELWVSREDIKARQYIEKNHIAGWVRTGDELTAWPEPPVKLLLQATHDQLGAFREKILPMAEEAHVQVFFSQDDYLEIVPEDAGKGYALERVAERLGVSQAQVMAVGDAENDMGMISWAGLGVAMGQAPDSVKSVADRVTETVVDDGAAVAIERWALGEGVPVLPQ